jgi:hypothetical protein
MKTFTLTQAQARGYFLATTKPVVIEFIHSSQTEPLEITGSRGKPISNGSAMKRLDQLADPQKYLFDNYDSRKQETRCGFVRWIPEGCESQVELRVTECDTVEEAVTISKFFRDTRLSKNRTIRRSVSVDTGARHLRMVGVCSQLIVDAGTTRNVALKKAA